jgi:hypothetical protein
MYAVECFEHFLEHFLLEIHGWEQEKRKKTTTESVRMAKANFQWIGEKSLGIHDTCT